MTSRPRSPEDLADELIAIWVDGMSDGRRTPAPDEAARLSEILAQVDLVPTVYHGDLLALARLIARLLREERGEVVPPGKARRCDDP